MKKLLLLISITLFIVTCDSDSPTGPSEEGTNQEDCEDGVVLDECGVCGGQGPITTYVEDCGYEYVCGWETVYLGLDSYCTNSCVDDGNYCQYYSDCYFDNGFAGSGCNDSAQCITYAQEYVCGNQYVCECEYITECP